MSGKSRERLSIHEAGRAVVACALGQRFNQVSIVPDAQSGALISVDLASPTGSETKGARQQIEECILIGLAGAAAEAMQTNHDASVVETLREDYDRVVQDTDVLAQMCGVGNAPGDRDILVLSLWERSLKLLNVHWGSVAVLSDLLLELGTASWTEVDEIFEHTTKWHAQG